MTQTAEIMQLINNCFNFSVNHLCTVKARYSKKKLQNSMSQHKQTVNQAMYKVKIHSSISVLTNQ